MSWLVVKMSEKKKFENGAQKRRLQREKEIRDKELLKKIPKLTEFFRHMAFTHFECKTPSQGVYETSQPQGPMAG